MTARLSLLLSWCFAALTVQTIQGQIVWTEPAFPTQDDVVTLYYDVSQGNAALIDEEPPCPPCPFVYAHTGVITSESTSPSDWQYVQNPWPNGNNASTANAGNTLIPVEGTIHSFDFGGLTLAEYYGVPAGVVIEQLAFVFRNADGSAVGKTSDEGDIFYNVSDGSFEVIFTTPSETSSIASLGETIDIIAQATQPSDLALSVNGEEVASEFGLSLSYPLNLDNTGGLHVGHCRQRRRLDRSCQRDGVCDARQRARLDPTRRIGGRHQRTQRQHGGAAMDRALQGICVCGRRLE